MPPQLSPDSPVHEPSRLIREARFASHARITDYTRVAATRLGEKRCQSVDLIWPAELQSRFAGVEKGDRLRARINTQPADEIPGSVPVPPFPRCPNVAARRKGTGTVGTANPYSHIDRRRSQSPFSGSRTLCSFPADLARRACSARGGWADWCCVHLPADYDRTDGLHQKACFPIQPLTVDEINKKVDS